MCQKQGGPRTPACDGGASENLGLPTCGFETFEDASNRGTLLGGPEFPGPDILHQPVDICEGTIRIEGGRKHNPWYPFLGGIWSGA